MKNFIKILAAGLMLSLGGTAGATTLEGLVVTITSPHGNCTDVIVAIGPECTIYDTAAQTDDFLQIDIQGTGIIFSIVDTANNGGSQWTAAPSIFDVVISGLIGFSILSTALDLDGNVQTSNGGTLSAIMSNPGELTFSFNDFDVFCGNETCATFTVAGAVAAVPLPAGLPLLLAGLGALGIVRRKRRAA